MARRILFLSLAVALCALLFSRSLFFPPPPLLLKDKRVVVCGASTGIGEDIAYRYAREGSSLVLAARRKEQLESVAEKCRHLGAKRVIVVPVDLSSEEGCEELIRVSVESLGGIDTLILNHIIGYFKNWLDVPHTERYSLLQKLFQVNAFSYFHLSLAALPYLNASESGHIGVVSSVAGRMGIPMVAPYSATKHSLHGFFESLRQDLFGLSNVSISLHTIGNIETPNAVQGTKGYLSKLKRYPSEEAANSIVESTERGERDSFYPWTEAYFSTVLYRLFPDTFDWIVRELYRE